MSPEARRPLSPEARPVGYYRNPISNVFIFIFIFISLLLLKVIYYCYSYTNTDVLHLAWQPFLKEDLKTYPVFKSYVPK